MIGIIAGVLLMSGCAGLSLSQELVAFDDPYAMLSIEEIAANSEETEGVLLRFRTPQSGSLLYKEDTIMFAQIKDGEGKCLRLDSARRDTYFPGVTESSFVVESETTLTGENKKITSRMELSEHGEIVRFIEGSHKTKIGKFIIEEWTRTALFPEEPVKIGDTWTYNEAIDMKIESWLIKNRAQEPYAIRARSTLDGFALCQGVRCAVIKTVIVKKQDHHLRILFKNIDFTVRTRVDETTYYDYAGGCIIAQIIKNLGQTTGHNPPLTDTSEGQSIIFLQND